MSDPQRIQADLARAKSRVLELESGKRGIPSADSQHINPQRALEAQLNAQREHVSRLELELVHGMLAERKTSAAAILAALEHKCAPSQLVVQAAPVESDDGLRAKLRALLERSTGFIPHHVPHSAIREVLES